MQRNTIGIKRPLDDTSSPESETKRRKLIPNLFNENDVEKANQVYESLLQNNAKYNLELPKESSILKNHKSIEVDEKTLNSRYRKDREGELNRYIKHFSRHLDGRIYLEIKTDDKNATQELEILYKLFRVWKTKVKQHELKDSLETKTQITNDIKIDSKFDLNNLGKKIIEVIPHLRMEQKNDRIIFCLKDDKESKPLAAVIITKNNDDRFQKLNSDNTLHKTILLKKVGRYNKTQKIIDQEINLDEYVYDANNVILPRYAMRAITPQERTVLAELNMNATLLPQGETDQLTPVETSMLPDLSSKDLKQQIIQSGILHRVGTRRLSCLSSYKPQDDVAMVSNKKETFFKDASQYTDYKYASPLRQKLPSNYSVQGGGLILIDLAKIPQENIFAQGKREAAVKIKGLTKRKKGNILSAESEKVSAMMSAYRNREIHVKEITCGSIIGWLPNHEQGWQKTVSRIPIIKSKDKRSTGIRGLDIELISKIEHENAEKEFKGQDYKGYSLPKAPTVSENGLFSKEHQGFSDMKIPQPVDPIDYNSNGSEKIKVATDLKIKS